MGLELILGAISTIVANLLKRFIAKHGEAWTLVLVFVIVFVAYWIYLWLYKIGFNWEVLVGSFAATVALYEVVLKRVWTNKKK